MCESVAREDMEEMASAARCRAMAAGGGTVAGRADGGTDGGMEPERGETEDEAEDGASRAFFV